MPPAPTPGLVSADYAIIAVFFAMMVFIGFYFAGRMRNMKDYFAGGRHVPWWLAGTSYYMSSFSAFAFVAYSALAYKYGFVAITLYWVTVPAAVISAWLVAGRWRRAATTSPVEFIEERYGRFMRQGLVWLGVPVKVIDDGLKLFAMGLLTSTGLGMHHAHALVHGILISGIVIVIYTLMGGLWAVLVTDFIQFMVMMVAVLVLFPLALGRVGGFAQFIHNSPAGFFHLTAPPTLGWGYILAFLFIMILSYSTSWQLVQRFYIVERDAEARRVGYLVAVLNIISPPLFIGPAMMAHQFLPGADPNNIYALLCRAVLPAGLTGLLIAAMFSSTMSMLSGNINATAAVLTNDVYRRLISPNASERSLVRAGRVTTLIAGGLSLGVAFLIVASIGEKGLFDKMMGLFSLFLPPIALPMIGGLMIRRVSNAGAIAGLVCGMGVGIAAYVFQALLAAAPDVQPAAMTSLQHWAALLGRSEIMTTLTTLTALAGIGIGSWLRPDASAHRARIASFMTRMSEPEALKPSIRGNEANDFALVSFIALVTCALGVMLTAVVWITTPWAQAQPSLMVGGIFMLLGGAIWICDRLRRRAQLFRSEAIENPKEPIHVHPSA